MENVEEPKLEENKEASENSYIEIPKNDDKEASENSYIEIHKQDDNNEEPKED